MKKTSSKILKKLTFVIAFICFSFINLYAQGGKVDTSATTKSVAKVKKPFDAPMADALRENGKIYVVVIVLGIVLTGLFIYLINLDRKVRKIESEVQG